LFTWENAGWVFEKFGSFIGVAGALGVYFFQQWKENRDRLTRATKALIEEIRGHQTLFTDPKYNSRLVSAPGILFHKVFFITDAYDGLLHAGLLTYFHEKIQEKLSDIYGIIREHNTLIRYMYGYGDTFFLYDTSQKRKDRWVSETKEYEITLTLYEDRIKGSLATIKQMLERGKPYA
jgi:hypothetical protein